MTDTNEVVEPKSTQDLGGQVDPLVMQFRYLPLGARFKFFNDDKIWVVLDTGGNGEMTQWNGIKRSFGCWVHSVKTSETECDELEVIVVA